MSDPPKKKRKTSNKTNHRLEYAKALSKTEFSQIHQCLHDPSMPSTINILRFGILKIVNNKFNKRSVALPGRLGTVGIPDDRETISMYLNSHAAARMRAGGCVSWWNPFDQKPKIGKFVGSYTSTLDSLQWNSSTTVSQLGRFPPRKRADRAPISDDNEDLIKDSSCMAIPNKNDPCFNSTTISQLGRKKEAARRISKLKNFQSNGDYSHVTHALSICQKKFDLAYKENKKN